MKQQTQPDLQKYNSTKSILQLDRDNQAEEYTSAKWWTQNKKDKLEDNKVEPLTQPNCEERVEKGIASGWVINFWNKIGRKS